MWRHSTSDYGRHSLRMLVCLLSLAIVFMIARLPRIHHSTPVQRISGSQPFRSTAKSTTQIKPRLDGQGIKSRFGQTARTVELSRPTSQRLSRMRSRDSISGISQHRPWLCSPLRTTFSIEERGLNRTPSSHSSKNLSTLSAGTQNSKGEIS